MTEIPAQPPLWRQSNELCLVSEAGGRTLALRETGVEIFLLEPRKIEGAAG